MPRGQYDRSTAKKPGRPPPGLNGSKKPRGRPRKAAAAEVAPEAVTAITGAEAVDTPPTASAGPGAVAAGAGSDSFVLSIPLPPKTTLAQLAAFAKSAGLELEVAMRAPGAVE